MGIRYEIENVLDKAEDLERVLVDLIDAHDAYVNHKTTNPDWIKEEGLRKAWNEALDRARKAVR